MLKARKTIGQTGVIQRSQKNCQGAFFKQRREKERMEKVKEKKEDLSHCEKEYRKQQETGLRPGV